MNPEKTQVVIFKPGVSKIDNELVFFGKTLKVNNKIKLLGITFDNNATFEEHCISRAKIANQRMNLLKLIRGRKWGANQNTLLTLYKQLIRPILEY